MDGWLTPGECEVFNLSEATEKFSDLLTVSPDSEFIITSSIGALGDYGLVFSHREIGVDVSKRLQELK